MKKAVLMTALSSAIILGGAGLTHAEVNNPNILNPGEITNPDGFNSKGQVIINEYDPDPTDPETTDPVDPLIPAPTDPTDPENPGTGDVHPLSIDQIANFTFTKAKQDGPVGIYNDSRIYSYTAEDGTDNHQLVLQDGWKLNGENKLVKTNKDGVEVFIDETGKTLDDPTTAKVYTDAKEYTKRIQVSDRRKGTQTFGWNLTLTTSPFMNGGKALNSTTFEIPMEQVANDAGFGSPISDAPANPTKFIGDATAGSNGIIAHLDATDPVNNVRGTWVFSVAGAKMDVKDANASGTYESTFNWKIAEQTPSNTL